MSGLPLWNCAVELRCGIALQCRRVLLCGFAVGCEDSEDTGFCPLRIIWCAPEQRSHEPAQKKDVIMHEAFSETYIHGYRKNDF